MNFDFLVTTDLTRLKEVAGNRQIIMLDGTVPGFKARNGYPDYDLHWDHHRKCGPDIQLDDLIDWDLEGAIQPDAVFVTTMVDADACVATAYCILSGWHPYEFNAKKDNWSETRKLRAIAYDCDHLTVPEELADLTDFASQAVAAMKASSDEIIKILPLPCDRKQWNIQDKELFSSEAFKLGTQHLVDACLGLCPFPGEQGEAENYWKTVEQFTQRIINEDRISIYKDCTIFDGTEISEYVDPRCWIKALKILDIDPVHPVTVTRRTVINGGKKLGYCYTLGTIPLHPNQKDWDYTTDIFDALTEAESNLYGNESKWGGRYSVGGSGLKSCSALSPYEVINICLEVYEQ